MPKLAHYTLAWSPLNQGYELYKSQGNEGLAVVSASPVWLLGVGQTCSFAFHGQYGSYTARKERKQRGEEGYWYADARVGGTLTKRYLGKSINLTLGRLEHAAQELWLDPQNVLLPGYPYDHSARRQGGSPADRKARPAIARLPTDSLLATKLHVPRPRPHLVHRSRLIQRLQEGMERALILLSAPAGFGKSTLLADWLALHAIPAAWLSLEPQDNDPARFLSYLLAALQTCDPQLGASGQALHHSLQSPPLGAVRTLLINDLLWRRADTR